MTIEKEKYKNAITITSKTAVLICMRSQRGQNLDIYLIPLSYMNPANVSPLRNQIQNKIIFV